MSKADKEREDMRDAIAAQQRGDSKQQEARERWICTECHHEHQTMTYCGVITMAGGCMCKHRFIELAARQASQPSTREVTQTNYSRLSAMLYRSLERLSLAIEACGKIGFEESKPITNAAHGEIWLDLNNAQKDAKLKLKHYAQFVAQPSHASGELGQDQFDPIVHEVCCRCGHSCESERQRATQAMAEKAAQPLDADQLKSCLWFFADGQLNFAVTLDRLNNFLHQRSLAGAEPSQTVYQRTLAAAAKFIDASQYQVTGQMLLDALGGGEPSHDKLASARAFVKLYLETYADTQKHPTAVQEAHCISEARKVFD
jgi:hypothetical protein